MYGTLEKINLTQYSKTNNREKCLKIMNVSSVRLRYISNTTNFFKL